MSETDKLKESVKKMNDKDLLYELNSIDNADFPSYWEKLKYPLIKEEIKRRSLNELQN